LHGYKLLEFLLFTTIPRRDGRRMTEFFSGGVSGCIEPRILKVGAGALVLVHNNPSVDPIPSKDSIAMTRAVAGACCDLDIVIPGYIIIGPESAGSLKTGVVVVPSV